MRQLCRELANRHVRAAPFSTPSDFKQIISDSSLQVRTRLRALWAAQTLGKLTNATMQGLLDDKDEHLRAWGVRLITDFWPIDTVLGQPRATAFEVHRNLVPR